MRLQVRERNESPFSATADVPVIAFRAGRRLRVKNGPDALEMGCLFYPRKQTSVSYAADCDVIVCYGGAKLTDKHLAATIHCVATEIIGWQLKRREQRQARAPNE
jgi:hypothetical protein